MMIYKRSVASALLSFLVVSILAAQSREDRTSPTLFFVNKKPVKTAEFVYLYRKNHQRTAEEFTEDKIEEYLKLFINYKLKVEEALARGTDTTSAFKKEYQTYREELLKPHLPDAKILDSLVALTYARLKEEVNVSHILIAVEPNALPEDTLKAYERINELRKRAVEGDDFGDLAAKFSDEPGARTTRGNLGFFTAMQMVFPFEQAAYLTPVGEISKPVRTQYGYHIIKVLKRRPARGEVEVSHIMIHTGDGVDDENARNTIFDIYDKLQKGMAWEQLCRQYSEDPNTKDKGGRLRPFGVGAMSSVPEFQEMAFALQEKGEISDPFQTQFGWHILRLEAKIPLPPFEEIKGSLSQRVSRDERVRLSRQALRERMKKELGYSENGKIKSEVFALADSSLTKGNWKPSPEGALAGEGLFTMQGHSFTVRDFLNYAIEHQHPRAMAPAACIEELFSKYIDATQIEILEDKISRESPDYKWLLKEYYEGILLFDIMEKEVWNRAMEDTVGQKNYFSAHDDTYEASERIAGAIYVSPSKETMEELRDLLKSNDSTAGRFVSKHNIKVQEGAFEKSDHAVLGKINWSPGVYLANNSGTNYVILIKKILPPGLKTFEEARSSVISDYQTYLEEAWIKELRAKFGVKMKKRAKKEVFQQLRFD